MAALKVITNIYKARKGNFISRLLLTKRTLFTSSYNATKRVKGSEKSKLWPEQSDQPVKFTTAMIGYEREIKTARPTIEPFVIIGSLAAFLIYFCILREENDVDQALEKPLYERIPMLEKQYLRNSLIVNRAKGLDTSAIEARLKELDAM